MILLQHLRYKSELEMKKRKKEEKALQA